jgi:hypothetical protein
MVRIAFFSSLLFIAACSEDSPEPGGPCKADMTCGGDLVCNFQAAEPTCLDPALDEDSDGLTNGDDFCPATSGGSNFDEDGDGRGDDCDSCPIERWTVNTKDEDGDGLSGRCDPDDREPGDKRALFDGFSTDTLSEWKLGDDAAGFSISGGVLKSTATVANPDLVATRTLPSVRDSTSVFVGYRVVNAAPADVDGIVRDVSVALINDIPMGGARARCSANLTSQASTLRLSSDRGEEFADYPGLYAENQPYLLFLQTEGTRARCIQSLGSAAKIVEGNVGEDFKTAVTLNQRAVAVEYQYVLVIQSPLR